jgi:hypothetical protein
MQILPNVYRLVSWNLGALQTNPYEFHSASNVAFVRHVEGKLKLFWNHKISHFVNEKCINDIARIAQAGERFKSSSLTDQNVSYLFSPHVGELRLLSWPDRFLSDRPTFRNFSGINFDEAWLEFYEVHWESVKRFSAHKYRRLGYSDIIEDPFVFASHLFAWDRVLFDAAQDFFDNRPLPFQKDTQIQRLLHMYPTTDIFAFQEADITTIKEFYWKDFHVCVDSQASGNQVSVLLLRRARFSDLIDLSLDVPEITAGDAVIVEARDTLSDQRVIFASFHGDTNGQTTVKFLEHMAMLRLPMVFGLDANAYFEGTSARLGFDEFRHRSENLQFKIGLQAEATTYNSRTYLQAQTHKASWSDSQMIETNPKDNILVRGLNVFRCTRDNTLMGVYNERNIPDYSFPSDHALLSCTVVMPSRSEL